MARYVLKFSKDGYFKYTSHLDLLRLFKRSFKRAGIRLDYSQGFNPHPKMSFAQPLSLGYSGIGELLEFECSQKLSEDDALNSLKRMMPEGLNLLACKSYEIEGKTLAALTVAAEYLISIPKKGGFAEKNYGELMAGFLKQEKIPAMKRQKKSKEYAEVDIKDKIQQLEVTEMNQEVLISALLDAGSDSNLSPELLIEALLNFFKQDISRYDIEVLRKKIIFSNDFFI